MGSLAVGFGRVWEVVGGPSWLLCCDEWEGEHEGGGTGVAVTRLNGVSKKAVRSGLEGHHPGDRMVRSVGCWQPRSHNRLVVTPSERWMQRRQLGTGPRFFAATGS